MHPLSLKEVRGIGPKRAEKLTRFGLNALADVAAKGMPLV
jgi:predicted flap endonuclease-1-like 5' DNA nuclease